MLHSEFCGSMRKQRDSVLAVWNLESSEFATWEKGRKCTILLASPFVGMITTLMGLFQVGSPVGYASGCALYSRRTRPGTAKAADFCAAENISAVEDCRNKFELYQVQAICLCWYNLLHDGLYSFQANRLLPAGSCGHICRFNPSKKEIQSSRRIRFKCHWMSCQQWRKWRYIDVMSFQSPKIT